MYNLNVEHEIFKHNENEMFVYIKDGTYRTRIEFNYTPDADFKGVAVNCNYHYKGHPVGYLKDNGLLLTKIPGHESRPTMEFDQTVIQAGPTLIENYEINKDFLSEGFCTGEIITGFHCHIGKRKAGHVVVGFTKHLKPADIALAYKSFYCQNAIKLPGNWRASFFFQSSDQTVQEGVMPIPVALVIEPRRQ